MKSSSTDTPLNISTHKLPSSFSVGPQIGSYQGHPIFEWLKDNHGVVRRYKGLVTGQENLAPGSIIATPGLLYEEANAGAGGSDAS